MYCALIFLKTQDVVSAGVNFTPLKQACQIAPKVTLMSAYFVLLYIFQYLIKNVRLIGRMATVARGA
jgi:hypothetical protein